LRSLAARGRLLRTVRRRRRARERGCGTQRRSDPSIPVAAVQRTARVVLPSLATSPVTPSRHPRLRRCLLVKPGSRSRPWQPRGLRRRRGATASAGVRALHGAGTTATAASVAAARPHGSQERRHEALDHCIAPTPPVAGAHAGMGLGWLPVVGVFGDGGVDGVPQQGQTAAAVHQDPWSGPQRVGFPFASSPDSRSAGSARSSRQTARLPGRARPRSVVAGALVGRAGFGPSAH
jgi:hypothetical protein